MSVSIVIFISIAIECPLLFFFSWKFFNRLSKKEWEEIRARMGIKDRK